MCVRYWVSTGAQNCIGVDVDMFLCIYIKAYVRACAYDRLKLWSKWVDNTVLKPWARKGSGLLRTFLMSCDINWHQIRNCDILRHFTWEGMEGSQDLEKSKCRTTLILNDPIRTHTYTHAHIHTHKHAHNANTRTHNTHTHTRTQHTHTHTHSYMHTHIYTHTTQKHIRTIHTHTSRNVKQNSLSRFSENFFTSYSDMF